MAERSAWFCPGCQKHHAPHVETCPAPVPAFTVPGSVPVWTPWQPTTYPVPGSSGDVPFTWEPNQSGCLSTYSDPNIWFVN